MRPFREYFNGAVYVKRADVNSTPLTLRAVEEHTITARGKPSKERVLPVIFFIEIKKGLPLNMTNAKKMFEITGHDDPEKWIGTRITLRVDETIKFKGQRIGGIRVDKAPPA